MKLYGLLYIFFPEMSIYKRYSDTTKCIYFMIKDENKLINIWQFGKSFNIELIYNKEYIKAEKSFQHFHMRVMLLDLVYRKDENYYPKVFLQKFIHNFFTKSITNFGFWDFGSSF